MEIKVIFLDSEINFARKNKHILQKLIKKTAHQVCEVLKVNCFLNIVVYPLFSNSLISRGGIHTKEWIELVIPPYQWEEIIVKAIISHEIHHLARGFIQYRVDGGAYTFLEAIFSEGLAIRFEEEYLDGFQSPYSVYDSTTLQKWIPVLRKEKDSTDYNHTFWFERSSLGYRMGKYFVDLILKRYPYLNTILLVKTGTDEYR